MSGHTITVVSDIHYASPAEQVRTHHETRHLQNPLPRILLRLFRDLVWLRHPTAQNHLLNQFLNRAPATDLVIANGDLTCDTAFTGLSDDAAFESAHLCLDLLRHRFGNRLHVTLGDHELGKVSLIGGRGGPRLDSWRRATTEMNLKPFWTIEAGRYLLIGITSTLGAWPVYHHEALPAEAAGWRELHRAHLDEIRQAFDRVPEDRRIILFCHDPTALGCLAREPAIRRKWPNIDHTIIGHLHSPLFLGTARRLAGLPQINFLGAGIRRMSAALHQARSWKPFRVTLCPSLAGSELLKDGGFLTLELNDDLAYPVRIECHQIRR